MRPSMLIFTYIHALRNVYKLSTKLKKNHGYSKLSDQETRKKQVMRCIFLRKQQFFLIESCAEKSESSLTIIDFFMIYTNLICNLSNLLGKK